MKSTLPETHPTKEEEEGASRGWLRNDKPKETPPPDGFQSHLELRLGITYFSDNNNVTTGEAKGIGHNPKPNGPRSWFSTCSEPSSSTLPIATSSFIHPWSLAARQKAAFEQSNTAAAFSRVTTPPPIGWPPVHSSRRNLIGLKPEMDGEKDDASWKGKVISESNGNNIESKRKNVIGDEDSMKASMYVKVHMEGFPVGRKMNLKAHDSYDSLSRALNKMFANFFSTNYSNNSAQEEEDEVPNSDFILLYEDYEGDRMLVGDVPWELFITSVKRLFIAHSRKKTEKKKKRRTKMKTMEEY